MDAAADATIEASTFPGRRRTKAACRKVAMNQARTADGDLAVVCTDQRLRERLVTNGFDRAVRVVQSISAA